MSGGTGDLAGALRIMVRTYEAHAQPAAAARLKAAHDEVVAGRADLAAIHALLSPRALPAMSVYPFDRHSQDLFYGAWDAALALTAPDGPGQGQL
jgi:hypothetical protein